MVSVILLYAILALQFPLAKGALAYVPPIFFCGLRLLIAGLLVIGAYMILHFRHIRTSTHFFKQILLFGVLTVSSCITLYLLLASVQADMWWYKLVYGFALVVVVMLVGLMSIYMHNRTYEVYAVPLYLFMAVFFSIFITNVAEFWSLQYLSNAKAAFFYNLSPFFAALFSYFMFFEIMNLHKWIGLICSFMGILPLIIQPDHAHTVRSIGMFLPELAMILASMSMVLGWMYVRKLVRAGYSIFLINGIIMLFGGILALYASWLLEPWHTLAQVDHRVYYLYLPLIVVICNIIGYTIYTQFLKTYTNTFLTLAGCCGPLWAALYGWYFFNESITWEFVLAYSLVQVGMLIFYRQEVQQGYIKQSV